jgi:hypothetical protein
MKQVTVLITVVILSLVCCKEDSNEEKHENRSPVIFSVSVFPEVVRPSDSLVVTCNASDPDGDTLVYDWYTTGVVRIKGAFQNEPFLFHTFDNSRIFYAPDSAHVVGPRDSFWVECSVRDRIGGMSVKTVRFGVIK